MPSPAGIAAGSATASISRNEPPNWASVLAVPKGWRATGVSVKPRRWKVAARRVEIADGENEVVDGAGHGSGGR